MGLTVFYRFYKGNKVLKKHLDVLEKSIIENKKTPISTVKFFNSGYIKDGDQKFEDQNKEILLDVLSNKPYVSIQAHLIYDDVSHIIKKDKRFNGYDTIAFNIS